MPSTSYIERKRKYNREYIKKWRIENPIEYNIKNNPYYLKYYQNNKEKLCMNRKKYVLIKNEMERFRKILIADY